VTEIHTEQCFRRAGSLDVSAALAQVARRHTATPLQVALAWLLARAPIMLPIPGTSKVAHLEENVAAASLSLTPDDIRTLEGPLVKRLKRLVKRSLRLV